MSVSSCVAKEFDSGIEEQTVPPAEVRGATAKLGRDGGDGFWEIGIDEQFDVARAFGEADLRVAAGPEVLDGLGLQLAPEVIERNFVIGLVESPHPDVGLAERSGLDHFGPGLEEVLAGAASPYFRRFEIGVQDDLCPARAGVGGGPAGPRAIAAGQARLEVAPVGEPLVTLGGVHRHGLTDLAHLAEAGGLLGLRPDPREDRKKNRREDGDDRNHHQQLDQRKPPPHGLFYGRESARSTLASIEDAKLL